MVNTRLNERLLPSLLDRLTDDDPVNRTIELHENKIKEIEKELTEIQKTKTQEKEKPIESKKRQQELLKQLDQERKQYQFLSTAVGSLKELRNCVKRDLDWLLNAHNFAPKEELEDYPEISTSVLNYGFPDLAGQTATGTDIRDLEKVLKQAVLNFEPRIIRKTLNVYLVSEDSMMDHNALTFDIEGELWADPVPIHMHLRTELELENGDMSIREL